MVYQVTMFFVTISLITVVLQYACRVQDVAELLGMMVEDHKRLQPNVKTYA